MRTKTASLGFQKSLFKLYSTVTSHVDFFSHVEGPKQLHSFVFSVAVAAIHVRAKLQHCVAASCRKYDVAQQIVRCHIASENSTMRCAASQILTMRRRNAVLWPRSNSRPSFKTELNKTAKFQFLVILVLVQILSGNQLLRCAAGEIKSHLRRSLGFS